MTSHDTQSPTTPGQLLASLLHEKGWDQRTFAIVVGVDETVVSKLVRGHRRFDAPFALIMEEVFGVDPMVVLTLRDNNDLALARLKVRARPTTPPEPLAVLLAACADALRGSAPALAERIDKYQHWSRLVPTLPRP